MTSSVCIPCPSSVWPWTRCCSFFLSMKGNWKRDNLEYISTVWFSPQESNMGLSQRYRGMPPLVLPDCSWLCFPLCRFTMERTRQCVMQFGWLKEQHYLIEFDGTYESGSHGHFVLLAGIKGITSLATTSTPPFQCGASAFHPFLSEANLGTRTSWQDRFV